MDPIEAEHARDAAEKRLLVHLTLDELKATMRETVTKGFEEAMTVEAAERFWAVGINMLRAHAKESAGSMVLAGFMKMLRVGFWTAVFIVSIYMIGGWSLVTNVFRALTKD